MPHSAPSIPPGPLGQRTPPAIKWLLAERAALLGLAERSDARAKSLLGRSVRLEQELRQALEDLDQARQTTVAYRQRADDLQRSLELVDHRVAPTVSPIRPLAGRYGERGALTAFVREELRNAAPEPLTGAELKRRAIVAFGLDVKAPCEHRSMKVSIRSALGALHGPTRQCIEKVSTGASTASWRWKTEDAAAVLEELGARSRAGRTKVVRVCGSAGQRVSAAVLSAEEVA